MVACSRLRKAEAELPPGWQRMLQPPCSPELPPHAAPCLLPSAGRGLLSPPPKPQLAPRPPYPSPLLEAPPGPCPQPHALTGPAGDQRGDGQGQRRAARGSMVPCAAGLLPHSLPLSNFFLHLRTKNPPQNHRTQLSASWDPLKEGSAGRGKRQGPAGAAPAMPREALQKHPAKTPPGCSRASTKPGACQVGRRP